MKKNISTLVAMAALLLLVAGSCKKAEYSVITKGLYFAEASDVNAVIKKKIIIDEKGRTITLTPRLLQKAGQDVRAKIVIDTTALQAFNKKNGTDYKAVPDELVRFSSAEINIKAGQVAAEAVAAAVKPFTQAMTQSGDKFALPVSLVPVSGTELLQELASVVVVFDEVVVTTAPIINCNTPIKSTLSKTYDFNEWSLEMRVNMSLLGTGIGQYNNQAIFGVGGTGAEIYIRFGDAPIRGNLLQLKTQGTQIEANTTFLPNKWYHLAFSCSGTNLKIYVNGNLDASLDLPGKPYSATAITMAGSGCTYFRANAMFSEVRFYTKAISQSQVQNNMFAINPKTPGMIFYWKMNEGSGQDFADATGNGNTAQAAGPINWKTNVRSDVENQNVN